MKRVHLNWEELRQMEKMIGVVRHHQTDSTEGYFSDSDINEVRWSYKGVAFLLDKSNPSEGEEEKSSSPEAKSLREEADSLHFKDMSADQARAGSYI